MVELLTSPPPMDAIARMAAIDGVRIAPTVLATQQGPDAHLGPEGAGAILLLQATFADETKAAAFWRTAAGLLEKLARTPGFIRRFSFADGPHHTLLALWRTKAEADAFFGSDEHRDAMRRLFAERWQHTHFAAVWELSAPRDRLVFCQQCDGVTPASTARCGGCGRELHDPFAATVPS